MYVPIIVPPRKRTECPLYYECVYRSDDDRTNYVKPYFNVYRATATVCTNVAVAYSQFHTCAYSVRRSVDERECGGFAGKRRVSR